MAGFRNIYIIGLALHIASVAVLVVAFGVLFMQRDEDVRNGEIIFVANGPKIFLVETISVTVEAYFFICINSLYLKIKEQHSLDQKFAGNILINQQHQPLDARNQSSSTYQAARHSDGGISMQVLHSDKSKFGREEV